MLCYGWATAGGRVVSLDCVQVHPRHEKAYGLVLTGRNAKDELLEIADLATEMELLKHPFRSGVKAQIGVEF